MTGKAEFLITLVMQATCPVWQLPFQKKATHNLRKLKIELITISPGFHNAHAEVHCVLLTLTQLIPDASEFPIF